MISHVIVLSGFCHRLDLIMSHIGVLKKTFKHNKFKKKMEKNKEIKLERAKSDFIMVWHPLPTSTLLELLTE